jgi:hypothetical protein
MQKPCIIILPGSHSQGPGSTHIFLISQLIILGDRLIALSPFTHEPSSLVPVRKFAEKCMYHVTDKLAHEVFCLRICGLGVIHLVLGGNLSSKLEGGYGR